MHCRVDAQGIDCMCRVTSHKQGVSLHVFSLQRLSVNAAEQKHRTVPVLAFGDVRCILDESWGSLGACTLD